MIRTRRQIALALESLEARETPAGVVNVNFAGGSVTIVGDEANNNVFISTLSDGHLNISDDENTMFRLNGSEPQSNVTLPDKLTGGVNIRLGDGADSLTVFNLLVPGSMRVHGGEGDNLVDVTGPLAVVKNLSITNGSGLDQLDVGGDLGVGGRVSINNGDGGSLLYCREASTIQVGGLSVTNGEGFDRFDLHGLVVVLGNFGIRNGAGGSIVSDVLYAAIGVGGVLSIINGAGADEIALSNGLAVKADNISIRHGPGNSVTTITPTETLYAGRNLSVVGGSDVDRVQLGGTFQAAKFEVRGSVLVNTGDGKDDVSISPIQTGTVGGSVAVGLGLGENQSASISRLLIAGGLRVRADGDPLGNSSDSVLLFGDQVGKQTTITTGAANDQVLVSLCTFDGQFKLSTGAGNDFVGIESESYESGFTRFIGAVTVRTGDGNDSVVVGHSVPWPIDSYGWVQFAAATRWDGERGTADHIALEPFNVFNGPEPVTIGFEA